MMERRPLKFENLDQVLADANHLLSSGYTPVGKWQLSQCCHHLADWLGYPIDGFPKKNAIVRFLLWCIKKTMGGPKALKKTLDENKMPSGAPTDPITVHGIDEAIDQHKQDQTAVERLTAAIKHFQNHQGPIHSSPIFGPMDKPTAEHLQRVHCAHHLSFLLPKN